MTVMGSRMHIVSNNDNSNTSSSISSNTSIGITSVISITIAIDIIMFAPSTPQRT